MQNVSDIWSHFLDIVSDIRKAFRICYDASPNKTCEIKIMVETKTVKYQCHSQICMQYSSFFKCFITIFRWHLTTGHKIKLLYIISNCIRFAPQIKNVVCANINIVDTSIQRQISGQSTSMVKGCMYCTYAWYSRYSLSYGRALFVC